MAAWRGTLVAGRGLDVRFDISVVCLGNLKSCIAYLVFSGTQINRAKLVIGYTLFDKSGKHTLSAFCFGSSMDNNSHDEMFSAENALNWNVFVPAPRKDFQKRNGMKEKTKLNIVGNTLYF